MEAERRFNAVEMNSGECRRYANIICTLFFLWIEKQTNHLFGFYAKTCGFGPARPIDENLKIFKKKYSFVWIQKPNTKKNRIKFKYIFFEKITGFAPSMVRVLIDYTLKIIFKKDLKYTNSMTLLCAIFIFNNGGVVC